MLRVTIPRALGPGAPLGSPLDPLRLRQPYNVPVSCVGGAGREADSHKNSSTHPFPSLAEGVLQNLSDSLAVLSPELIPIHERLVNCRRQLVALATKETAIAAAKSEASAESGERAEVKVLCQDLEAAEADAEPELSKTPTKDVPNPEPPSKLKVKAELKPIQEELRKIDSLSFPPCCRYGRDANAALPLRAYSALARP